jgi:hypothetical protein
LTWLSPWDSRRNKSLFASFSSEKEESALFLKKKKQKDFCFLRRFGERARVLAASAV